MEENKQEPLSPREAPTEEIEVSAPAGAETASAQDASTPPASTPPAGGKSIKKNYFYNLVYQLFLVVVPTVVTPYVARVLGDEGSGQYSFTYSLLTYFTLFAALGFGYYAQRLVAKHQGDKRQQSIDFWEVMIARAVPVVATLAVYLLLIFLGVYEEKYKLLMIILTIEVVSVFFNIAFFFQGNEEFGKTVLRNVIVKSLGIAAIFLFVRDAGDLWVYALIQALTVFFANISLWLYLPRALTRVSLSDLHPMAHLKPAFFLFLPTIATSVYTSLDKTFIGLITHSDSENGNYEYAEKLVKMAMMAVTSLGVVMIPRNARKFEERDLAGVRDNINRSTRFVLCLGIPMTLGIVAVADNLIPWFLGGGYDKAANLMKLLAPLILIIGLSNVFGLQYLVPSGQDKRFTIAITAGAFTNLALNCVMIYFFASYGAAVATLIAEAVVTLIMYLFIRRDIDFLKTVLSSWKYYVGGAVMFPVCFFLGERLSPSIAHTLLLVGIGIGIYLVMLLILHEEYLMSALRKVKKILSRKKNKEGE